MCQQKFGTVFKVTISRIDDSDITLYIKRKGLPVILPIGMHIIFGEYDFVIAKISAPFSFDIIKYTCGKKLLTNSQIMELIEKYKWREYKSNEVMNDV